MAPSRFEPSAEILDWTTYKRAIIAKGRLVSRLGLVAEIGEVAGDLEVLGATAGCGALVVRV